MIFNILFANVLAWMAVADASKHHRWGWVALLGLGIFGLSVAYVEIVRLDKIAGR